MAVQLTKEVIELIGDSDTTKVLATLDADGFPYAVVKQSVQTGEDGNLLYLELLDSSLTNRNLVRSLWFNQNVSIALKGKNGQSYQIKGKPVKTHITGLPFQKHYLAVRERLGDANLAVVWVIEPVEVIDESLVKGLPEEKAAYPFFRYLDRLSV